MSSPDPRWNRLIAAARRAEVAGRDENAPHGFATRVVARAFADESAGATGALLSRYALRAFGVACLLAIACVAANLRPILNAIDDEAAAIEASADLETTELS